MTIKASAISTARAIELPPGALYTTDQNWYLRAQLKGQQNRIIEAAIPLTEGADYRDLSAEPCMTLAPSLRFECRLIGEIKGPGHPLPGALTWTVTGELVVAWEQYFVSLDGIETNEVHKSDAFYVTHWGVWVIDHDGKQISPDPLFVIGADVKSAALDDRSRT